jgi:hypothetical protein
MAPFNFVSMSNPVAMTPEEEIFTFKQESEENFKEAWSRISESYSKTDPRMVLSIFLRSFYFGLILCYMYALDAVVGGDFLGCDGDKAYNAIKKMLATHNLPSKIDISIASIHNRLNTLETKLAVLHENHHLLREHLDHVATNSEPSSWLPTMKISINDKAFRAQCDIMSEFCLMPKDICESLNLWGLIDEGEEIPFADNTTISPVGVAKGVFTQVMGRMASIDYFVIECAGTGRVTLRRSLLQLMGAVIDVGTGIMKFTTSPCGRYVFPKVKKNKGKKKKKRARRPNDDNVNTFSPIDIT